MQITYKKLRKWRTRRRENIDQTRASAIRASAVFASYLRPPVTKSAMHLMYTLDESGNRIYTLKVCDFEKNKRPSTNNAQKITDDGKITKSAHPGAWSSYTTCAGTDLRIARFSPDDKFSRHRVTIKKRYGVLPTQLPAKPL